MLPDCDILHNTDYEGNNILIKRLEPKKNESVKFDFPDWAVCADLCSTTPGALFWTWDSKNKKCYVKNSKSGKKPKKKFISGNKECVCTYYGNMRWLKYTYICLEERHRHITGKSLAEGGDATGGATQFKEFVNGTSMFTEALLSRNHGFHVISEI